MEFDQALFNAAFTVGAGLAGIIWRQMSKEQDKTEQRVAEQEKRLNDLGQRLASEYLPREEFRHSMKELKESMETHFQRVYDKFDQKADK